jgi:hypothetical protein
VVQPSSCMFDKYILRLAPCILAGILLATCDIKGL